MYKKRLLVTIVALLAPWILLFGGTGRPNDGFLAFIVLLGFFGIILGILYLVDYIKILIRKFLDRNGEKMLP